MPDDSSCPLSKQIFFQQIRLSDSIHVYFIKIKNGFKSALISFLDNTEQKNPRFDSRRPPLFYRRNSREFDLYCDDKQRIRSRSRAGNNSRYKYNFSNFLIVCIPFFFSFIFIGSVFTDKFQLIVFSCLRFSESAEIGRTGSVVIRPFEYGENISALLFIIKHCQQKITSERKNNKDFLQKVFECWR